MRDKVRMFILIGGVEISDQVGTSKEVVIGAFTSSEGIKAAKTEFEGRFRTRRTYFKEYAATLDEIVKFPLSL